LFKLFISLFLFISIIQADEISQLLSNIKTAKPQDKRVLINKLKVMLRNSNAKTRINAIKHIQEQNKHIHQYNSSIKHTTINHNTNSNTATHIQNSNINQVKRIGSHRK